MTKWPLDSASMQGLHDSPATFVEIKLGGWGDLLDTNFGYPEVIHCCIACHGLCDIKVETL